MTYIDGFVPAVPTANREAFRRHAEAAAADPRLQPDRNPMHRLLLGCDASTICSKPP